MVKNDRAARSRSFAPEALETRNLLSTLIGSKPTLDAYDGAGVSHNKFGGISISQPAVIQVFGTAQPGAPGSTVSVSIFAENSEGNLVNGGVPLATTTPDLLGRYNATVTLPSRLRADVNYLVARETASAVQVSQVAINPTTLSGLNGGLTVAPGTLSGLAASIANPTNTLSNLSANISNPATTLDGFGASVTTPSTPISNLAGTISIGTFPVGAGTGGPAVGTLLGGSGTLGAQVGTITGGSGTIAATNSTLSNGSGTIGSTTSTLTQTGTALESNRTGTFTQSGTAAIASTTGTSTFLAQEVATSDPLVVLIHQPKNQMAYFPHVAKSHPTGIAASVSHVNAVHAARAHKHK